MSTIADTPTGTMNAAGAQTNPRATITQHHLTKGFKNGIKGMMKVGGALSSARANNNMHNAIQQQIEEDDLGVEDLVAISRGLDDTNKEDSMNLTDSNSGLRTSIHKKGNSDGSDSPRGFEEYGAGANIPQEAQAGPLGGSDPSMYATTAKLMAPSLMRKNTVEPLSPVPTAAARNTAAPTSAPVHLETGQGYSPNSTKAVKNNNFLKGKIKISALKNFVGNGLDLSASSHGPSTRNAAAAGITQSHHTNMSSTQNTAPVKRNVGFSSDVTDAAPAGGEKAGSRIARSMRKSIIGLGGLAFGLNKQQHAPMPMVDDTEETDEPPQLKPMPIEDEEIDEEKTPAVNPKTVFQEQEEAKRRRREKHSQRVAKRKPKDNGDAMGESSHHGGTVNNSDHTNGTNDDHRRSSGAQFRRNTTKSKLDSRARERLKEHSKANEHNRNRNRSANRQRRKQLLQDSSRGNDSSAGGPRDRMVSSERITPSSRLANSLSTSQSSTDHRMANSDRSMDYNGNGSGNGSGMLDNTSEHFSAQDNNDDAQQPPASPRVSFKPTLLRAPSGEVSAPKSPVVNSRKLKKEQDEKLRERVRSRQSFTMQNMSSFSVLELLDDDVGNNNEDDNDQEEEDDDSASFADDDDIDEDLGPSDHGGNEPDDGLDLEREEEGDDKKKQEDVVAAMSTAATPSPSTQREKGALALKDIFRPPASPASADAPSNAHKTGGGGGGGGGVMNSVPSKDSLDVATAKGSFQHVETEKTDGYLQLVIGNNVPPGVASPTSGEADAESTAGAVATTDDKPKRKTRREKGTSSSKHKTTSDSKHKEGVTRRKPRPGTEKSSRHRERSPRRKTDESGLRRRKAAVRDQTNGNASEPSIVTEHLDLAPEGGVGQKRISQSGHPSMRTRQLDDSAKSGMSQSGSDHGLGSDLAMIDASAKSFADEEEPAEEEETNQDGAPAAAGEPSSEVEPATKEGRRDGGGEVRKRTSRSGKEKRSSGGERKTKSRTTGGESKSLKSSSHGEKERKSRPSNRGRPSEGSSKDNNHTRKSHKSSRGHSEAGRRESRGDRAPSSSNRRRHSLDARKRLSTAAAAATAKSDLASQEQLGKSLAAIKW